MKKIAIYGAGGFGREIALLLEQINEVRATWEVVGFYDDGRQKDEIIDGLRVLGGSPDLNGIKESLSVVIAIADPETRCSVARRITNPLVSFPLIRHPRVVINEKRNQFGAGCIITEGCILTTGIVLDDFVIINLSTTIGHDVALGAFTSIMPGVHISGNVRIGEKSFVGSGAVILQNLQLGKQLTVGAGAVVTHNFPDHCMVVGIPAVVKTNAV